jgi:alanine racemase
LIETKAIAAMPHNNAPIRLHLDGAALVSNWRFLRSQGDAACGAAVKADAYGLGSREVVRRLRDAGCKDFFVAHWGEAAAIADLIPPEQIAVFNGIGPDDIEYCRSIGAIPVLNTPSQVERWRASGGGLCHVMVDSGINRLGIGPEQMHSGLFASLDIDILMTHLACADEDSPENEAQLASFLSMSQAVPARRRSMANSSGIMLGRDYHFDLTRPGMALYGGITRPELRPHIKQVVRIQSQVLQIRKHNIGARIGYNGTYVCGGETKVATCSIGYADGYRRNFSGSGMVSFGNISLPVIGRVSMDLITVDATNSSALVEGDWVDVEYSLELASMQSGLSQYELLTGLGQRFERRWS